VLRYKERNDDWMVVGNGRKRNAIEIKGVKELLNVEEMEDGKGRGMTINRANQVKGKIVTEKVRKAIME
jgi:hypothetical protein